MAATFAPRIVVTLGKAALFLGVLGLAGCENTLGAIGKIDCAFGCDLENAVSVCADGCVVDYCLPGFGDCNTRWE